jgi:hypothetical protein
MTFFNLHDYEAWKEQQHQQHYADQIESGGTDALSSTAAGAALQKQWRIKYYKGLGTSSAAEAREYFSALETHMIDYVWDDREGQLAATSHGGSGGSSGGGSGGGGGGGEESLVLLSDDDVRVRDELMSEAEEGVNGSSIDMAFSRAKVAQRKAWMLNAAQQQVEEKMATNKVQEEALQRLQVQYSIHYALYSYATLHCRRGVHCGWRLCGTRRLGR